MASKCDLCKLVYGSLSEERFKKNFICLVTSTNSVTCLNFGAAKDLAAIYEYGDIAGKRYRKNGTQIAVFRDRSEEGSIYFEKPPGFPKCNLPTISTIITQYGIGESVENNPIAKESAMNTYDKDHASRLLKDTMENRLTQFRECLIKLKDELVKPENDFIKLILIPAGIGRSGKIDKIWFEYYQTSVFAFSVIMNVHHKTVAILVDKDRLDKIMNWVDKEDEELQKSKDRLRALKVLSAEEIITLKPSLPFEMVEEGKDVVGNNSPINFI